MARKQLHTTRSQIRSALRQLWLRSRERASALKQASYCCAKCGAKQSRAKGREVYVEVHHKDGLDGWNILIDKVYEHLLHDPERLEVLCKECHKEKHNAGM